MKKYRFAILGTGRIAATFAKALSEVSEAEFYAVGSRTKQKADAFAEKFGAVKSYGSYEELADDKDIDAVYIATPMSCHFDNAMLCINKGKHILCEKSVSLDSRQLDIMLKAAAEKELLFMEAMWTKCRPVYIKVLDWIRQGRIGKVKYVKADFNNLVRYDRSDRLFAPELGGGALLDLLVYPLTLSSDVFGEYPESVTSAANIGKDGVDLSNAVILKYKNGFAALSSGFEVPNNNNALISGEKGSIIFSDWFFCTSEAALYDRNGSEIERINIPDEINGYEYEIREFCRCLDKGLKESTLVPHSSTKTVMKIMDKCRSDWNMQYPDENVIKM